MRIIPRVVHGMLDYIFGALLLAAPALFDFSHVEAERNIAWSVGGATLLYSAMTAYEISVAEIVPFRVHFVLDLLVGGLLLTSPWIFGFSDQTVIPLMAFGAFAIIAGLMTSPKPPERPIITSR